MSRRELTGRAAKKSQKRTGRRLSHLARPGTFPRQRRNQVSYSTRARRISV